MTEFVREAPALKVLRVVQHYETLRTAMMREYQERLEALDKAFKSDLQLTQNR